MAVAYESSSSAGVAAGNPVVLTYSTGTIGASLIVAVSQADSTCTITPPTGWSQVLASNQPNGYVIFSHTYATGDGTTFSFSQTAGSAHSLNGILMSFTGADVTTIQSSSQVQSSTTETTPGIIPGVLNMMQIGVFGINYGAASPTPGTGFTNAQSLTARYYSIASTYDTTLTADTVTTVSTSLNWSGSTTAGNAAILLIGPPQPGAITTTPSALSTFAGYGSANAQTFTISQPNYTGAFTVTNTNTAAATLTPPTSGTSGPGPTGSYTLTPVTSGNGNVIIVGG